LKWVSTTSVAVDAGYPKIGFQLYHDYLGRRILKYNYQWNGSSWSYTGMQRRYVYDGWNLLYELDGNGNRQKLYVWGLDVSGTLQGAGGVGGLLVSYDLNTGLLLNPVYDGNGNVVAMLNRADGSIAAAYEYDAFGNTIRESGPYAAENPFRFSTKFTDLEFGLVYYGQRCYHPSLGRFINRDPIEESGGLNLYSFCRNNGVNRWDYLGMDDHYAEPDQWTEHINDTDLIARMVQGTPLVWARTLEDGRWTAIYRDEGDPTEYTVYGNTNGAVRMRVKHYNNDGAGMDDFGRIEDAEAEREAFMAELDYFDKVAFAELDAPSNTAGTVVTVDGRTVTPSVRLGETQYLGEVDNNGLTSVAPYEPWDGSMTYQTRFPTYQSPHVANSNDLFNAVANDFGRYRNSFQLAQNGATVVAWGAVGGIYAPVVGGVQMTPLTRYLIYKGIEIFADQYLPSDQFPPEAPQDPPAIEHPIGPFNPPGAGPNP